MEFKKPCYMYLMENCPTIKKNKTLPLGYEPSICTRAQALHMEGLSFFPDIAWLLNISRSHL